MVAMAPPVALVAAAAAVLLVLVTTLPGPAAGAPLLSPDFAQCRNITLKYTSTNYRCCPPVPGSIKEWRVQDHLPVRVRRPAHTLVNDTEYWDKFNRAYAALRALPKSDPRAWENQAWMHCSYCNNALLQRDQDPETVLLIHKGWLFLPWHRWYVYFHERILARLIDDDTFALPFWNFDNQTAAAGHFRANTMPPQYTQARWAALGDAKRSKFHQPPHTVDIPFDWVVDSGSTPYSDAELANRNLQAMHRQIASAAVPEVFFGHRYVAGTPDAPGGGSIEYIPHNSIHDWTGDLTQPDHENMGNFYSAARDPLFYGLHANLDRLWHDWVKLGGRRGNIDDPDWLDTDFTFFDENGDAVKVTVRDALDIDPLRYRYEQVENAWVDLHAPVRGSPTLKAAATAASAECRHPVWEACRKMAAWARAAVSRTAAPLSNILDTTTEATTADTVENVVKDVVENTVVIDPEAAAARVASIPLLRAQDADAQAPVTVAGAPFHFRVARPRKPLLRAVAEALRLRPRAEQVLVLQGLTTRTATTNIFDVFVNLPEADATTPLAIAEYAGSFYEIPHTSSRQTADGRPVHQDWRVTNFRLAVSEVLRQLGVEGSDDPLVVTVVPRGVDRDQPIIFKGVTVELF